MQMLLDHIAKDGFRLRGTALSRIDGFSDVVFGFALTLLVVSLEVPHTYDELHAVLLGFIPFAICFCFFMTIWWAHFRFFRRYDLHDMGTILINCVLLFTVLFYVYPLKFLSVLVVAQIRGRASQPFFSSDLQNAELMTVYCLGFTALYLCLAALYFNAWRQRHRLHLNPLETTLTLCDAWDKLGIGCVGLICCLIAQLLPARDAGQAGWCFFSVGIWSTAHGFIARKRISAAQKRTSQLAHTPPHGHI